jgi:hypothetical protein
MYRPSERIAEHVGLSADLLKDTDALRTAMMDVVREWPIATSQNLSNLSANRRSWLGQAACCMAHGSPELMTCQAWWTLTEAERDAANAVATEVISRWEQGVSDAQAAFGF